ncbi:MAG: MBL fold metallo-hydrolase [Thiobacillus sp.]
MRHELEAKRLGIAMSPRWIIVGLLLVLASLATLVRADDYLPRASNVIDNVYVIVGPLEERTYDNQALNANQAFIVTAQGVALIDPGASYLGAQALERAIRAVTDKPVRWVINTGSQDHRWLGNGYFKAKGAEIIALADTVKTQQAFAAQHIERLERVLKDRYAGTRPAYAAAPLPGAEAVLNLGGETVHLIRTDAHFPGDSMVWIPRLRTVFTGDLIYHDRLMGVHEWSNPVAGLAAYERMRTLSPGYMTVIPGHGEPGDLAKAERDSGAYYRFLVKVVGKAAADMEPLADVIKANAHRAEFAHLKHFDSWHGVNMSRTYLMLEGK